MQQAMYSVDFRKGGESYAEKIDNNVNERNSNDNLMIMI